MKCPRCHVEVSEVTMITSDELSSINDIVDYVKLMEKNKNNSFHCGKCQALFDKDGNLHDEYPCSNEELLLECIEDAPLSLTEDEVMATLSACVFVLSGYPFDTENETAKEQARILKSAIVKFAQSIGMSRNDLAKYAVMVAGTPSKELVELFCND